MKGLCPARRPRCRSGLRTIGLHPYITLAIAVTHLRKLINNIGPREVMAAVVKERKVQMLFRNSTASTSSAPARNSPC
jgi:hypothetical protein